MTDRLCGWGIMGSARIARKNWLAIRNAENATLVAVASRSAERAETYVRGCQATAPFPETPVAIGGYDRLLARDDIDAVYIPLPTGMRKEWVIRAAEAGKHVLCEKPTGVDAGEVAEMIEDCRQNNVQFMDGVMFTHSRRFARLREVLDDGVTVGPIRRIASHFTFGLPEAERETNIRTHSGFEPLGCLGDVGWYNIRLTLWLMNYQMPSMVSARMLSEWGQSASPAPVPMDLSAELLYEGGVSSSFYCSFVAENQQWATIGGEKGHIHVRDFVLPFQAGEIGFDVANWAYEFEGCVLSVHDQSRRVSIDEPSDSAAGAQETHMVENFSAQVLAGTIDPFWPEVALKTQTILDACLASARAGGADVAIESRP